MEKVQNVGTKSAFTPLIFKQHYTYFHIFFSLTRIFTHIFKHMFSVFECMYQTPP